MDTTHGFKFAVYNRRSFELPHQVNGTICGCCRLSLNSQEERLATEVGEQLADVVLDSVADVPAWLASQK